MILLSVRSALAAAALTVPTGPAGADDRGPGIFVEIPVPSAISWDALTSPVNDVREIDLAARIGVPPGTPVEVVGVGWSVSITTFATSWLSEAAIHLSDPDEFPIDLDAAVLAPGLGRNFPGSTFFLSGGARPLSDFALGPVPLPRGVLRLEFFETFDDAPNAIDAFWTGTITLAVEPGTLPPCSEADLAAPFGVADLADVTAFVQLFLGGDPAADLVPPFGLQDLADIVRFIEVFLTGCD